MARASVLALVFCGIAGAALAQDRPPEPARGDAADTVTAPVTQSERPVDKPDIAPPEPAPAPQPVPAPPPAVDDSAAAQAPAPAMKAYGPPMPPQWWLAREGDQDFAACRLALSMLGTVYTLAPQETDPEDPECGIARPIRVTSLLPDLELQGGALMRCETARALGFWARDFVRPAAATLPDAPRPVAMQLGTTYDCRGRISSGAEPGKLSEHAKGTAIDIAAFVFGGAEPVPVSPRRDDGDRIEAFQRAVRGAACLYFTTVLGPGSNAAHDNHLHLDLARRRGDWRLCQ